ncbi:hypothetical protein [Acholeplasma hippikon]|uniref:Uncharacterized protein n=1 Tax=Acholeplasma hippikon TaxID=264636 RepID=A0A449BI71_9MOLU|nr:hypothetical protein [Acholeplasma hippikon]VEU82140.1 Uncharacterised protein [Acholeplasma hippikon]
MDYYKQIKYYEFKKSLLNKVINILNVILIFFNLMALLITALIFFLALMLLGWAKTTYFRTPLSSNNSESGLVKVYMERYEEEYLYFDFMINDLILEDDTFISGDEGGKSFVLQIIADGSLLTKKEEGYYLIPKDTKTIRVSMKLLTNHRTSNNETMIVLNFEDEYTVTFSNFFDEENKKINRGLYNIKIKEKIGENETLLNYGPFRRLRIISIMTLSYTLLNIIKIFILIDRLKGFDKEQYKISKQLNKLKN